VSADTQTSKTEARTQAQRERILAAAHSCFIRQGFHVASMATIAETAGMSPGLIYRYFENKNAIILSIIERQLADARSDIATLRSDTDFISLFSELFEKWKSEDPELMSPALMLEMTAEASRDPQIGQALAESDKVTGRDFNIWLTQTARLEGEKPTEADVKARVFALRCLIGGLAIRAIREPDIEKSVLQDSLKLMLPNLLSFRT
jgi:AcrR family transcriptional regulator